jgi:hypothetical protein
VVALYKGHSEDNYNLTEEHHYVWDFTASEFIPSQAGTRKGEGHYAEGVNNGVRIPVAYVDMATDIEQTVIEDINNIFGVKFPIPI